MFLCRQELWELKKENFGLKSRIYHLEEAVSKKWQRVCTSALLPCMQVNSGSSQLKYLRSRVRPRNWMQCMDDLRDSAAGRLMEDSTIHSIGCGNDMNALSSAFTDFRVHH